MKNLYNCFVGLLIVASCASKEEIYYLQDASDRGAGKLNTQKRKYNQMISLK